MRKEYDFSQGKRGAVLASPGKTRITIMLDDDIIEFFRAHAEMQGCGYQTLINTSLRDAVTLANASNKRRMDEAPLTAATLRKILREELHTS
jgi:BrnA antitoxin of type II toxin-antitoxin system